MEKKKDNIQILHRQKKILIFVFIAILVIQIVLLGYLRGLAEQVNGITNSYNNLKIEAQTDLINNVIRPQQRRMLIAVREGWQNYLQVHPDTKLLLTDSNGLYIYKNIDGDSISLNPKSMYAIKQIDGTYDIYDSNTKQMLLKNSSMQWNILQVKNILNIIAAPIRAFGPTGDVIVFDSNTGEMLLDNSNDCKNIPQVLAKNNERYITLDDKHPGNKNPKQTKNTINNFFMWKSDSDSSTKMVYMFEEPTIMSNANNFSKYSLGSYKREFQEKVILPYQTSGVEGQDMQITIVLGAQEPEICSGLNKVSNDFDEATNKNVNDYKKIVSVPIISMGLSLIVIMFALFVLKVNSVVYHKNK